ncbi:sigma-70 family RNA polymerase sigma factor [Antrihabitans stalactiti]|uniref:RNA polymerase sigma factor n=1 Tax=Antrihabitans stalactiti TaxID=2584121 RepID=A0A848KI59_9NOCA|nr:sigma-70 family RNA polymerase sigma factor [Antrihabitans stalactiti]NMN98743.1 sigma-70 family RNA polymerase sigma factor [Antrihabitans stalactiti]
MTTSEATRVSTLEDEFATATDPFRRELLAHCYRMLGSTHDAEDLVQETLLRAWRAFDRFDERKATMRTWLHRIATNACLTALDHRSRRVLPSGLGGPSHDVGEWPLQRRPEIDWIEPLPQAVYAPTESDPAAIVASRNSVRLAFIAALQTLPPRQRAVLLLRDVLAWSAAEVAEALDTSTAAVNSTLQRARAELKDGTPAEDDVVEPEDLLSRDLVDRYVTLLETADVAGLEQLLRDDAILEMPPIPNWYVGADAIVTFIARIFAVRGAFRVRRIEANGQPAAAVYARADDGSYCAHSIQVFTVTSTGIAKVVVFQDPTLFEGFGLQPTA